MTEFADSLRTEFRKCADAADARQLARFFKTGPGEYGEGDCFLGIRVPVIRQFVQKYAGELSLEEVAAFLESPYHEERMLAVLMLVRRFERGDATERQAVFDLYLANLARVNNWDLVDQSAPKILGAYLYGGNYDLIYRLAQSSMLWDRRIAVIATHWNIRQGDVGLSLEIVARLLDDSEDLMHKACGWTLREVGKRDRAAEVKFLRLYAARMPRTMLRYAIEHFSAAERKRYMKR